MKNYKKLLNILIIPIILFGFNNLVKAEKGVNGEEFDSNIFDQVCQYHTEENSIDVLIEKNLNKAHALIYKYNGKKVSGKSGMVTNAYARASVANWTPNINQKYAEKKDDAIKNKKCSNGTCPSICPTYAMVAKKRSSYYLYVAWTKETLEGWASKKGYDNYKIVQTTWKNTPDGDGGAVTEDSTIADITTCDDIPATMELIKKVYNFLKYLIPVIIIGLGILDFVKVVLSDDSKVFKDAWSRLLKRIIIGIVILILPAILTLIINLSGVIDYLGVNSNDIFCIFS